MGLYNVVAPCFVNGLHYVRPTVQPIQVDDTEAALLVAAGSLEPYPLAKVEIVLANGVYEIPGQTGTVLDGEINVVEPDEVPADEPAARKPRARRTED